MSAARVLRGTGLMMFSSCSCKPWMASTTFASRSPSFTNLKTKQPFLYPLHIGKTSRRSFSFRASLEAAEASTATTTPVDTVSTTPVETLTATTAPVEASTETTTPVDPIREAVGALDIRVGHVLKAWIHPEADSLYVEEVDVGEEEPRTICSGLVRYVPLDDLQGKKVVVLANLKPRNMRGVKSNGMLLAASDASHENVELLLAPEGSVPGERIWFGLEEDKEKQSAAASPNQVNKKKIWEMVQPHLKTDGSCVAAVGVHPMRTSAGVVVCRSLQNAKIS